MTHTHRHIAPHGSLHLADPLHGHCTVHPKGVAYCTFTRLLPLLPLPSPPLHSLSLPFPPSPSIPIQQLPPFPSLPLSLHFFSPRLVLETLSGSNTHIVSYLKSSIVSIHCILSYQNQQSAISSHVLSSQRYIHSQHHTRQYSTTQHNTTPHHTVHHSTARYKATKSQRSTTQNNKTHSMRRRIVFVTEIFLISHH